MTQTAPTSPNADPRFVEYYAEQSAMARTRERFDAVRRIVLAMRRDRGEPVQHLDMADVGCGAGSQALLWAADGHRAHGVDISAPLVELARKRKLEAGAQAEFYVGSAAALPFSDRSLDVVLVSELLEHVTEWEPCVDEAVRVLRPGGLLYISTTNRLCPVQQEFALPGYSWYPQGIKKRLEQLAVTTHGHWVQYTSFPAVHWFSFFQLRDYLDARGVSASDRFDVMSTNGSVARKAAVTAVRSSHLLRFAAHVLTPYTVLFGYRRRQP